jgi:putative transcriptional regulator
LAISYRKLREVLFDRKIQLKKLCKETGISHTTLSKINKDEHISLETLETIATYLKVQIGDIVEVKS